LQLDRTHIVIRARTLSEIGDLAMILIRNYPAASILGFLAGMLPWMLMNFALIGWIPWVQFDLAIYDEEMNLELWRYLLLMITLVTLQTPIAGILTTTLIGRFVFEQGITWRSALRDLRQMFWRWFWVLGVVRGPIPLMILLLSNWSQEVAPWREVILPILLLCLVGLQRGRRPFIPEILLLERCPLRSKNPAMIKASRRVAALHGPLTGELIGRFATVSLMLSVLFLAVLQAMFSARGFLLGHWDWGLVVYLVFIPTALWVTAGLSVLIRFLSYLDTRIRLEGWEVDLAVRAETQRQFQPSHEGLISAKPQRAAKPPSEPLLGRDSGTVKVITGAIGIVILTGGLTLHQANAGLLAEVSTTSNFTAVMPTSTQAGVPADDAVTPPQVQPLPDTVWFDADEQKIRPIPVTTRMPTADNRDSRWLPKPPKISAPSTSSGGSTTLPGNVISWANVFGWILLVVLAFGLIFLVLFLFGKIEPDAVATGKSKSSASLVEIDDQTLERMKHLPAEIRHTNLNLREEAERLMRAGRFDEAIVMLFGHQLLLLDRCSVLRLARGKTNGRYLRETRSHSLDASSHLVRTIAAFEASYFGGHSPSAERFMQLWNDNTTLESIVRSRLEAVA